MAVPEQPPRLTGNSAADVVSLNNWAWRFYQKVVIENLYLQAAGQFNPGDFDAGSLTDPAAATIATAQNTANNAYVLAASAKSTADTAKTTAAKQVAAGQITISDAATSGALAITTQANANYIVTVTAVAKSGAPAAGSTVIDSVTKAVSSITINLQTAPGAGTSRTFDVIARRA